MMFIPDELVYLCTWLIQGATMESKVTENLMQMLASKRSLVVIESLLRETPELPHVFSKVSRNQSYRGGCWLSGFVVAILALNYSWVFLSGLIPVIFLYYRNRKEEYDAVVFMSALMLSLEILCHDFAGWGSAFPRARNRAQDLLNTVSRNAIPGEWLEYILSHDRKNELGWTEQFAPYVHIKAS